ncbi:hypothetical protein ACHAXA_005507 [Cyclostephanos tholiformis]|uniref:Uncharacterized protein n=1 Tax=Cyclostephanos tholiformis TaxID=382380 RepID=A0ABD3RVD3_9STRA
MAPGDEESSSVTLCLIDAVAASVVAIILDPGNIVYIMAGITVFNSLLSAFKEYHIMKLPCE